MSLYSPIENDGHVIVDVLRRGTAKNPATGPRQLEVDHRLVEHGVELSLCIGQPVTRDDRAGFHGVESAIHPPDDRHRFPAPPQVEPPGHVALELRVLDQLGDPRHVFLCHKELARQLALVEETREDRRDRYIGLDVQRIGRAGGIRGLGRGVGRRTHDLLNCRLGCDLRFGLIPHHNARPLQGAIDLLERGLELPLHVRYAELQEGRTLYDLLGSGGVGDSGKLDDEPFVADLLNEWLRNTEFVDTTPDHGLHPIDGVFRIRHRAGALVDFNCQMHAALQIEAELEAPPGLGRIRAVGGGTYGHLSWPQAPQGHRDQYCYED